MTSNNTVTSYLVRFLFTTFVMWVVCVLVIMIESVELINACNKIVPIILFVTCLKASYSVVKVNPLYLWTPLPWFITACGVYYGFGALVYVYGTPESIYYANQVFPVDEYALIGILNLNCASISIVLIGFILGSKLPPLPPYLYDYRFNADFVRRLLLFCLAVGLPAKYLIIFPAHLGMTNYTVSNLFRVLANFTTLSIIITYVLMMETRQHKYKLILTAIVVSELIISLMMYAKIAVVITVLTLLLSRYLYKPDFKSFAVCIAIFAVFHILILTPFVNHARIANAKGVSSLSEFSSDISSFNASDKNRLLYDMPGVQAWWLRLSYSNFQNFALYSYDNDMPGDTFNSLLYAFLPRALFPDKPILTTGKEFNVLVTGLDNNQISPGFFAEAYWNGGWIYLVLSTLLLGLIFSVYTKFSVVFIEAKKMLYLPPVFSGIMIGLRPDDWYVPVVIVTFVQSILMYAILRKIDLAFGHIGKN